MRQTNAVDLEARVRFATEEAANVLAKRVRLEKAKDLAEARDELRSGMHTFVGNVLEQLMHCRRDLGVPDIKILDYHIVAVVNEM